jgi:hypothetical protein
MRRTSRRAFGKQLAGAAAAFPLASMATSAQQSAKDQREQKASPDEIRYHENTPPPLLIEDGSLSFSIKKNIGTNPLRETASGDNYIYEGDLYGSGHNDFHHVRILHGSGKLLYDDAANVIVLEVQEAARGKIGELLFEPTENQFKVTSKKFTTGNAQLRWEVSGTNTKKHRFVHQGSGANDFRVSTITVKKEDGSSQTFSAPVEANGRPFSQEYRILVWFD